MFKFYTYDKAAWPQVCIVYVTAKVNNERNSYSQDYMYNWDRIVTK